MVKINVSLPEKVLKDLDRAAGASGTSRSALFVRAFEHYAAEQEEEEKRQRRVKAIATIRALAEKMGEWDAVGELLESRDSH